MEVFVNMLKVILVLKDELKQVYFYFKFFLLIILNIDSICLMIKYLDYDNVDFGFGEIFNYWQIIFCVSLG